MIFIETARLILRNVATKDADNMYDYRNKISAPGISGARLRTMLALLPW